MVRNVARDQSGRGGVAHRAAQHGRCGGGPAAGPYQLWCRRHRGASELAVVLAMASGEDSRFVLQDLKNDLRKAFQALVRPKAKL